MTEVLPWVLVARDVAVCDVAWLAARGVRALVRCGGAAAFHERLCAAVSDDDPDAVERAIEGARARRHYIAVYASDLSACGACLAGFLIRQGMGVGAAVVELVNAAPACLPTKEALYELGVLEYELHGSASVQNPSDVAAVAQQVKGKGKTARAAAAPRQLQCVPTVDDQPPPFAHLLHQFDDGSATAPPPREAWGSHDVSMEEPSRSCGPNSDEQPPPFAGVLQRFSDVFMASADDGGGSDERAPDLNEGSIHDEMGPAAPEALPPAESAPADGEDDDDAAARAALRARAPARDAAYTAGTKVLRTLPPCVEGPDAAAARGQVVAAAVVAQLAHAAGCHEADAGADAAWLGDAAGHAARLGICGAFDAEPRAAAAVAACLVECVRSMIEDEEEDGGVSATASQAVLCAGCMKGLAAAAFGTALAAACAGLFLPAAPSGHVGNAAAVRMTSAVAALLATEGHEATDFGWAAEAMTRTQPLHSTLIARLQSLAAPFAEEPTPCREGNVCALRTLPDGAWGEVVRREAWPLPPLLRPLYAAAGRREDGVRSRRLVLLPYYGTVQVVYRYDSGGGKSTSLHLPTPAACLLLHLNTGTDALPLADLRSRVASMPPAVFDAALGLLTSPAVATPLLRRAAAPDGTPAILLNKRFRTSRAKLSYPLPSIP